MLQITRTDNQEGHLLRQLIHQVLPLSANILMLGRPLRSWEFLSLSSASHLVLLWLHQLVKDMAAALST
jgi:hypothetical protein